MVGAELVIHLRVEARGLVSKVLSELEIPVFLITHDTADVSGLAQTVVEMNQGRIVTVKNGDN